MTPNFGDVIDVWFSCGAASAVAAKLTLDQYRGFCDVRIINNPVAEEDPDNRRFLRDVEAWLGAPIYEAKNSKWPNASADEVWAKERFMAGRHGAPCTRSLKKEARQEWETTRPSDWLVMGFTSEEQNRHDRFALFERASILPILIDANLTKADCFGILRLFGLRLPAIYSRGYPNANCPGCVKASSPTYWNHVRRDDPIVHALRASRSRDIGARLVRYKGKRIFLDELPPDAKGRPMKSLPSVECGIFCEEPGVRR